MKTQWDLGVYRTLQVTLALGSAYKPARDVVVVTNFWTLGFFNELLKADVAPNSITIFLLLASTEALHLPIRLKNCYNPCFPHDQRVKELYERVFSDFHYSMLVKVIKLKMRLAAAAHIFSCWV